MNDIDRYRAIATPVTLDDRPAKITGARNDFATVRSHDGKLTGEWAWQTAIRIADTHGRFSL